ncbi:2-C-methyl-D-erythritol 4-phosphate cytidylyltransferase [Pedobacter sp. PWIIR3]
MNFYAIVVAGGSGNRMNSAIPKQFLLLEGKPVLMHTLCAFHQCVLNPEIILVLNHEMQEKWKSLCEEFGFDIPHRVVAGGEQRFYSVKNGLSEITGDGIVAIHDAVRPLISPSLITQSFKEAEEKGNCVTGVTPTDSVRRIIDESVTQALDRSELILIQTPQTFDLRIIREAYNSTYVDSYTDDASVVESIGIKINVIPGDRENIKITYPEDIDIATIFMKKKRSS